MGAGFELYDGNGLLLVSTVNTVLMVTGYMDVGGSASAGDIYVPSFGLYAAEPWCMVQSVSYVGPAQSIAYNPIIQISGTNIHWFFPAIYQGNIPIARLIWGIK